MKISIKLLSRYLNIITTIISAYKRINISLVKIN